MFFLRGLLLASLAAVSVGTATVSADDPPQPKSAPVSVVPKSAGSEASETLKLKTELQYLREQLRAVRIQAAQCDAHWADARARLANYDLTAEGETLTAGRDEIGKLAKAEGLTIEWPSPQNRAPAPAFKTLPPPAVEPANGAKEQRPK